MTGRSFLHRLWWAVRDYARRIWDVAGEDNISFLAGGIAAAFPECIGEPYGDGSGTKYLSLIGQPILIYGADRPALSRALERALSRNVTPAIYTEDMFKSTHDAANREVVKAVVRAELNLVGLAMRAERKVIDKIVDGLKFHS